MSIISIDGNIGSGKTSLLKLLQSHIEKEGLEDIFSINKEDIKSWTNEGWTELYYNNINRYSLGFQLRVLMSQHEIFKKIQKNKKKFNIIERSPLTNDYVFGKTLLNDGNLHKLEYDISNTIRKEFGWKPTTVIYIHTPAEICLERIIRRDRNSESSIPLNYLRHIENAHLNYIKNILPEYDIKSHTLDGSKDIQTVLNQCLQYLTNYND
jgi:deoxyadenosine/deoxycytidine kinase